MKDYLAQNESAYDAAADEYANRLEEYNDSDVELLRPFTTRLHKHSSVLELGPGSGLALKILTTQGIRTTAIDISKSMLVVAHAASPTSRLIHDDFLAHDFGETRFDGIVAKAFFHCFPAADAHVAIDKARTLLAKDGLLFLATTIHHSASEGYEEKVDYPDAPTRYRKRWTEQELLDAFASGWQILNAHHNSERGKKWLALTLQKA